MKKDPFPLALGLLLALIAGAVLTASFHLSLEKELQQASLLLLGLGAMAALSRFAANVESSANAPLVQFPSNDRRDTPPRAEAGALYGGVERRERRQSPTAWGPSTDELLAQDPALALAKLRIDLEGELRRVAIVRHLPLEDRQAPVHRLLEAVTDATVLDAGQCQELTAVLRDCNAAIHGVDTPATAALEVIQTGTSLLGTLRHS